MKKVVAALFSAAALAVAFFVIVNGIGDPCWAYCTIAGILGYWSN